MLLWCWLVLVLVLLLGALSDRTVAHVCMLDTHSTRRAKVGHVLMAVRQGSEQGQHAAEQHVRLFKPNPLLPAVSVSGRTVRVVPKRAKAAAFI